MDTAKLKQLFLSSKVNMTTQMTFGEGTILLNEVHKINCTKDM